MTKLIGMAGSLRRGSFNLALLHGQQTAGGAQHGLSMIVPGSGPPDSRLFASRVSPGEHINITPAGEMARQAAMMSRMAARAGGGQPQIKVEVHNTMADAAAVDQESSVEGGVATLRMFIRRESAAERRQSFANGELAQVMSQFGARRAPIRR